MRGLTIGSSIADLYQIGMDIDEAPGGFARAFLATNGDGKQRAIKVFRAEHFALPEERCYAYYKTLANEADLLVEMQGHPNVVRLYDMGFIWPDGNHDQAYDAKSYGMDARAFEGNFLFSLGPNNEAGGQRTTACHIDIPLRRCTVLLDDVMVVERGKVLDGGVRA